jgi:RNA polymerase sigma factor (sigma-70 family)
MQPPAYDVEFLREHSGYVRSLARKLVFDEQAAQDVEQETWLAALEHAPRDPRSPRAWLAQLVRNFAFAAWRVQKRREQRERAVSRPEHSVTTPQEVLERESVRRTLVEAVLALDEPYRTALILRFIDDLDAREIARRLHTPLATVRTRIKRGLEVLRANLRREHGDEYGAWSIALVHLLRLEPASYRAVATAAAKTLIQGALVMTVVQKVVVGAAALVVLAASLFVWERNNAAERNSSALAALAAEAENLHLPQPEADPVETPIQSDRSEVSAQHALPPTESKPVDSRTGSLAIHVVWGDDKKPAADVNLKIYQSTAEDFYRDVLFGRTGEDGVLVLPKVLPGKISFEVDRGAHSTAKVIAGERADATLEIEWGFDVSGKVLDVDSSPVAGADVYSWGYGGDSHEGYVVARSREDGSYFVRSLPPKQVGWLSARAPRRAPTPQKMLLSDAGAKVTTDLVFLSKGGSIEGRVLDPDGTPVAGAEVMVGRSRDYADLRLDDGSPGRSPAAQRVFTDVAGRYRIEGVAEGAQPIFGHGKGFAPWRGDCNVTAGIATTLDIPLMRGVQLTGSVRDEQGSPVVRASVTAGGFGFGVVHRSTAADGSFAMKDLPLGEFAVYVDDETGIAQTKLFGVSGVPLHWDAVISKGLTLRGRLVAPGRNLEDWSVNIRTANSLSAEFSAGTDADGRFEFAQCPEGPLHLTIAPPGVAAWPIAELDNVRGGPGEITISPDPALEPSVHIRGRVLGADGKPMANVQLIPRSSRFFGSPVLMCDPATGSFDLGPYPPGEWHLDIVAAGYPQLSTPTRSLAAGETHDLGDLQLATGGSFVATLVRDAKAEGQVLWFSLYDAHAQMLEPLRTDGAELRSGPLVPGKYRISLGTNGVFTELERNVEIRAGEVARFELNVRSK